MERSNWRPAALSLTVFGAVLRLLPHPPNFAPVGATSVFAGARLPVWQAYLVPIALLAVTDPIINAGYGLPWFDGSRLWVYASFLVSVWIGRHVRKTESALRIGAAVLLSAVQFFVITNFGTWAAGRMYPHTAAGLATCYVAALPFFGWTLLGDATYAVLLFGAHAWLTRTIAVRERIAIAAA